MFHHDTRKSSLMAAVTLSELIFHSTVRSVRQGHGNAVYGLLINVFQTAAMLLVFYFVMTLIGMRGSALRGNYFLYMMTGISVFMAHTKTMGAVSSAGAATSQMQQHGPMTTAVSIASAALGALYLQVLTMAVLLYGYHVLVTPLTISQPVPAMGMVLMAWAYGVALGLVLLGLRPWAPRLVQILQAVYTRASMFASGKMFVANSLSYSLLQFFDWNPLFHIIDQVRGFTFINYNPHHTSWEYPVYVSLAVAMIGMMAEFYTRRRVSASWSAR
ncbi:ABC transporter permease [Frigidibacter mobilis]|uniref:ABC transporter, permease protein n=1 Tax=Frigidibacter mobilis TaxID=1335048 RepID=A0A159Z9U9_9RHOB|nr:ABC transporter permease [Frigidibacter mobilis]AMY71524.1 ABC transporter, permease protein [Frigidibacter mobilis]